ncbi:uncharacterized protein V6R79_010300 [Siganus canaliculatus]
MFWAVCADFSPLLPVSGLAIVAGAEWMGCEPEMMLKTPSVSTKRLECIHCGQNKHLLSKRADVQAGKEPQSRARNLTPDTQNRNRHCNTQGARQTSERQRRKSKQPALSLCPSPPSSLLPREGSGVGLQPRQSGQQ